MNVNISWISDALWQTLLVSLVIESLNMNLLLSVLALLIQFVVGMSLKPKFENYEDLRVAINSLVDEVIDTRLNECNCIGWVEESGALFSVTPSFRNSIVFSDKNLNNTLLDIFTLKCQGWILLLSDKSSFLEKWEEARRASLIRFNPKMLFLPWNETSYSTQLFQSSAMNYISYAMAVEIKRTNGKLELEIMSNMFYLGEQAKKSSSPQSIGIWPFHDRTKLFANPVDNLMGKELRLATLQYLPYSQIYPYLDGVELRIHKEFCRAFNCTLQPVADDDLWGEIFDNGTSNGIVGNVYKDKADFGVGAVYLWYYDHIEFAYPYMPSKVTVLLPQPSPMPEWRVPLAPFDVPLWIALVVSVMTVAAVLYYMNFLLIKSSETYESPSEFQSWSGVVLRAVGMAVLQSPQSSTFVAGSSLRIVFTTFELLFLLYTTIYCSALSSVLTVPAYYPPIDNMRELHASGLPWAADHVAWVKNLMDADEPMIKGLLKKFEIHDQDTLKKLVGKGGYGFTIELTNGGHVSEASFLSADMINNLHVMKEALYYTYSTTVARKGSPYIEALNGVLLKCVDSGLLQLWESDMISKHGSSSIQTAFQLSRSGHHSSGASELVKLRLQHTQGAFILLLIGSIAGALAFLFECYCSEEARSRTKQLR